MGFLRSSALLFSLFFLKGLGTSESTCPTGQDVCLGAPGVDHHNCCSSDSPDCCDRGNGTRYCHTDETDSPCCRFDTTECQIFTPTCVPNKKLCGGKCCTNDDGFGVCCGDKECCQYTTSKCRKGRCSDRCTQSVGGKKVTKLCKEPNTCCQGQCVNPKKGKKGLPCKGLCCDFGAKSFQGRAPPDPDTVVNGVCCNGACCNGTQTCCKGTDGKTACGIPCGKSGLCCRPGTHCCGGRCVDDNTYCVGNCCVGSKAGTCCNNNCCPKPQECCGNPFPGDFFFGTCCGKDQYCCGVTADNPGTCCQKGKPCTCGIFGDACCP